MKLVCALGLICVSAQALACEPEMIYGDTRAVLINTAPATGPDLQDVVGGIIRPPASMGQPALPAADALAAGPSEDKQAGEAAEPSRASVEEDPTRARPAPGLSARAELPAPPSSAEEDLAGLVFITPARHSGMLVDASVIRSIPIANPIGAGLAQVAQLADQLDLAAAPEHQASAPSLSHLNGIEEAVLVHPTD